MEYDWDEWNYDLRRIKINPLSNHLEINYMKDHAPKRYAILSSM